MDRRNATAGEDCTSLSLDNVPINRSVPRYRMKTIEDDAGRGSQSEWSLMNRSPMETVGLERGKTVGQSELDEFRGRMDAKLPCDVRLMKFHRLDGNMELMRNLFCCPALG
jgi:hypothetical protein